MYFFVSMVFHTIKIKGRGDVKIITHWEEHVFSIIHNRIRPFYLLKKKKKRKKKKKHVFFSSLS